MGLTHTLGRNHNIDIAINLTRDLNDFTKFSIIAMRGHWNVTFRTGSLMAVWIPVLC